jgi:hypothetical protein
VSTHQFLAVGIEFITIHYSRIKHLNRMSVAQEYQISASERPHVHFSASLLRAGMINSNLRFFPGSAII